MRRRTLLIGGAVIIAGAVAAAPFIGQRTPASPGGIADATPAPQASSVKTAMAAGETVELTEFDRVLGDPSAPVTIVEYASFTCPHCATFHADTLPALKTQYLDTGKAKLVFRDFPLDQLALRASMLARCAPREQYFNLVDALFGSQRQWSAAEDPIKALAQIGLMAGIDQQAVDACLADDAMADRIVEQAQSGQNSFDIEATPTFIIDGEKITGAQPIEEFASRIDAAG